jgi:hypothetical protein
MEGTLGLSESHPIIGLLHDVKDKSKWMFLNHQVSNGSKEVLAHLMVFPNLSMLWSQNIKGNNKSHIKISILVIAYKID